MAEKERRSSSRKYATIVIASVAAAIGIGLAVAYYMEPEGEFVAGTLQEGQPFSGPDTTVTDPLGVPPEPADNAARLPNPFASSEEQVVPSLNVSSLASDDRGSQVTVAGSEFTPNEQIAISIDQRTVETEGQIVTDDTGSFSADMTLPTGLEGEITITGTDESGKSASANMEIDS